MYVNTRRDGDIREFFKVPPGGCERGRHGGKFKRTLSQVNARAVSRGQNELIGKFKMAAGDVISIRGQVIPTGIKRDLMRFGMDHDQEG